MAALNFPSSPVNGQQHTQNSKTWEWDGVSWNIVSAAGSGLPSPSSDNVPGDVLTLDSNLDPVYTTPAEGGGGAAGGQSTTLAIFTPLDSNPPSVNHASLDSRNYVPVLDFDAGTEESAVFPGIIPENANLASGLMVILHWMATSATSGAVVWSAAFERMNTDVDADSFATAVAAAAANAPGTSGLITTTNIQLSQAQIDGLLAGEAFRLKIARKAADGSDTMTGDAELVRVEVRQTATTGSFTGNEIAVYDYINPLLVQIFS